MKLLVLFLVLFLIHFCSAYSINYFPKPKLDGRIVGGYVLDIQDVPYQVSLQVGGHICGGSIISPKWILTAAHCTDGQRPQYLRIRMGTSTHASNGTLLQIKRIVQHENFSYNTIDYDFSLLELTNDTIFDSTKQNITLPDQNEIVPDNTASLVSGWGTTGSPFESRAHLRAAIVPIVNQTQCNRAYSSFGGITDRMICAGYDQGGKDACQGDSGGPLVADGKLVGVVSWGYGCAKPSFPGVYSRVASVRNWIKQKTGV